MHARSGSFRAAPDRLDDAIAQFERDLILRYWEQSGYKGFSLLVDRPSGQVIGLSFWDSESDLEASEELGDEARRAFREASGAEDEIVRKVWEVPIDDLP